MNKNQDKINELEALYDSIQTDLMRSKESHDNVDMSVLIQKQNDIKCELLMLINTSLADISFEIEDIKEKDSNKKKLKKRKRKTN